MSSQKPLGSPSRQAACLSIWFCLNVGLTILNKAVFSNFSFPYPMTLSCVHYLCSAIGARFILSATGTPSVMLTYPRFKKLFLFSAVFNINILLGNASIKVVSIALSQTVRSIIPATTMLVCYLCLSTVYSTTTWLSVLPVIVGMMLACYGDMGNFSSTGMLILIAGCFASATKVVMTKVLLSGDNKFHPFDLLSKVTPLCLLQLAPIAYVMEGPLIAEADNITSTAIVILFSTGIMALSLNIANFFTNQIVSPLTITIAGSIKQVTTIALSIGLFHTQVSMLNGIGIIITIIGGVIYSLVTVHQKQVQEKQGTLNMTLIKSKKPNSLLDTVTRPAYVSSTDSLFVNEKKPEEEV